MATASECLLAIEPFDLRLMMPVVGFSRISGEWRNSRGRPCKASYPPDGGYAEGCSPGPLCPTGYRPDDPKGHGGSSLRSISVAVLRTQEPLTLEEIAAFLREKNIAPFKYPERLEIIDALPMVSEQKVNKKLLEQEIVNKLREEKAKLTQP